MTANQQYKKYKTGGGTLGFKDWVTREKKKGFLNETGGSAGTIAADTLGTTINELHELGGQKTELDNKYIFGINRKTLIITAVVVTVVAAGIIIYKKKIGKG